MASIPLAIQTPQPTSPLTSIGQLMGVRNAVSEIALRQAQTQQAQQQTQNVQAEAQQKQRELATQNTIQQVMQDPEANARMHTGDFSDLEGKIPLDALERVRQAQQTYLGTKLAQTKEQAEIASSALGRVADGIAGLKSLTDESGAPDLDKINAALPGLTNQLRQQGTFQQAGITGDIPQAITDPKQLDQWASMVGAEKAVQDKVIATKQEQAKTEQASAAAKFSTAEAAKTATENEIQRAQLAVFQKLQANPALIDQQVDSAITDPKIRASTKVMAHQGASYKDVQDAINKGLSDEREQAKSVEVAKQTAAIQDPYRAVQAMRGAFSKSASELAQVQSATDLVDQLVSAAKSGNTAASRNLPALANAALMGFNNIKRQNPALIQDLPGSAIERLEGHLTNIISGKEQPDAVLADVQAQQHLIMQAAEQRHASEVSGMNAALPPGSRGFTPMPSAHQQQTPEKIRVKRKADGATGTIDAGDFDAAKYEKL